MPDRIDVRAMTAVPALLAGCVIAVGGAISSADEASVAKYLRPSGEKFVPETEVRIQPQDKGYRVTSVTTRGETRLSVTSRFDSEDRLREASVTLRQGTKQQTATATVKEGKAHVVRAGQPPQVMDCPQGVIVTSAPDWTEAILTVRRYDPAGKAQQEFPGLWVHPTRPPLRPTFKLTRLGRDTVKRSGEEVRLLRLRLELRGGSRYVVWRDEGGRLVRLLPGGKTRGGVVLAGWEKVQWPQ